MKKTEVSVLTLSAVSALVLPQYAQAVATYEAEAIGSMSFSTIFTGDLATLEFGEGGTSWTDTPISLSGDASYEFLGSAPVRDTSSRVLGLDLRVTGEAGTSGSSGEASNRQSGSASFYVYCSGAEGGTQCDFTFDYSIDTFSLSSVDDPLYESASAEAYLTPDLGLLNLDTSCSLNQSGPLYTCSISANTGFLAELSGYVEGSASARYPNAVPAPASLALFGVGAMGLAAFRRRKTKSG